MAHCVRVLSCDGENSSNDGAESLPSQYTDTHHDSVATKSPPEVGVLAEAVQDSLVPSIEGSEWEELLAK